MPAARRDVFQAIADPTRRDILSMIADGSMHLNAIADSFELSRPAVSQHAKVLAECGLIEFKKVGRKRYCELQVEKLAEVAEWIEPFKQMWESRFNKLDNLLDELKTK